MPDLLLLRHGQSQWNLENRFTGWIDVPLAPRGEAEARAAGEKLRGRRIDKLFTSVLVRATETARLALETAGIGPLPADSPYDVGGDRRYAGIAVPDTESLKDTIARALPYYEAEIVPALSAGKRVLVAAHGNSLRGIIKYLSNIGDDEIVGLEIPTGKPIVYELAHDLSVVRRHYLDEA